MKVTILNRSDIVGGAARAAYRTHSAFRDYGIDSRMMVARAESVDPTVEGGRGTWPKAVSRLRNGLASLLVRKQNRNGVLHSPALFPSSWPTRLNRSDTDIVNLHWIAGEMLSVRDISRLRRPLVWTLHDMWAFCGAEHYAEDFRWREGYDPGNRPSSEKGLDVNRWVWRRKRRYWDRLAHIVTPSRWLAQCAAESVLMRDWPVTVIPNPIDTEAWKPIPKTQARHTLNLPDDRPLMLFGADSGTRDRRKGFDLLHESLVHVREMIPGLELVVFGQSAPRQPDDSILPVRYTGLLHDDVMLRLFYSACDVLVIPSRQDNLPNTGVEALACALPVVAFDTCGLPDVVQHRNTGYLAQAFDPQDLANGIHFVLSGKNRKHELAEKSRRFAVQTLSYPVVAKQYADLFDSVLN